MARPPTIAFCGSSLDREAVRRRDRRWLDACRADPRSRYLPVWQANPLLKRDPPGLAWARPEFVDDLETPEPVLLGTDGGVAHFAVDVSSVEEPEESFGLSDIAGFDDLRGALSTLPFAEAGIAAQARSLVDWHARHRHCAACGGKTRSVLGGANRVCSECGAEHFPRTDPVAIGVVVRGDRCLLGRGPRWPGGFFSALAGFVEVGESLEEAMRREVQEETGVHVGEVRYLFSQPWPYPSSLMLGCVAEALDEELQIDTVEIEEARWFTRDALRAALARDGDDLHLPPPFALAHQVIRVWVESATI